MSPRWQTKTFINELTPVACCIESGQSNASIEQMVAYESNGQYIVKKGETSCDNTTFGDAIFGLVKSCYLLVGVVL